MKSTSRRVPPMLVAAAAILAAHSPASASDGETDSGSSHPAINTAIPASHTLMPEAVSPAAKQSVKQPMRRIIAKLWRDSQSQPQTSARYQYENIYSFAGASSYTAIVDSFGHAIGFGAQTPPAPTKDSPTQPPSATPATTTPPAKTTAPATPAPPAAPASRALPSPIENPPYPFTDWTINSGFPIGESWDSAPGTLQHLLFGTKLDNTHWRIGGWADAGIEMTNAKHSNLPDTYNLIPNRPELDQFVLVAQKMVDTVQKRYVDLGFYSSQLYGIDYRFTTATGYFSDQLNHHNNLYGYDPVLNWGEVYLPKVADGTVIQFGRYISPIDIEAQLSNSNYLYSHSLMFGVDPYTYTGINAQVRVNKEFEYMLGIHAGNENTPWSGAANANLEALIGWSSADNKDSLWGGLDSWTPSGKSIRGHDDEQIVNFVWGHVFTPRFHMQTQAYYMWEWDALVGGTPINGPSEPFAAAGAGAPIPGKAYAIGFVNNLEYKLNKNDYMTFRDGFLSDPQGWRTGTATDYTDITLGYSHLFARNFWIRPEVRYDHSYGPAAFDNGTLKSLFSIGGDIIMRF